MLKHDGDEKHIRDQFLEPPQKKQRVTPTVNVAKKTAHDYALEFFEFGGIVFPLSLNSSNKDAGKSPVVKWSNLSREDCEKLIANPKYKTNNWGLATGKKSGVWVMDLDPSDGKKECGMEYLQHLLNGTKIKTLVVKSGKGLHYYFTYDEITSFKNSFAGISIHGKNYGIDVRSDNGYIVLPGSVHYKTGNTYNVVEGDFSDISIMDAGLFHHLSYNKMVKPVVTSTKNQTTFLPILPVNDGSISDEYKKIFESLSVKRSDDRDSWIRALLFLKTHGEHYKEVGRAFSQKSEKHVDEDFETTWQTLNIREIKNPITISTFKLWLKEDQLDSDEPLSTMGLDRGDKGLAELFYELTKNELVIKKDKSTKNVSVYKWCEKECLWVDFSGKELNNLISTILEAYICDKLISYQEDKKIKKEFEKIKSYILSNRGVQNVSSLFHGIVIPKNQQNFNTIKHLLPIKNNRVIDLKTLEVLDRKKEHYFTVELGVDYLDNRDQWQPALTFLSDLYHDDELRTFITMMLGYGMTGEDNLKSSFFCIGESNCGKSVLCNLYKKILGPFGTEISPDVTFKRKKGQAGAHSAQLGFLGGFYRSVFISESGKNEELSEVYKQLSGHDQIPYRLPNAKDILVATSTVKPFCFANFIPKWDPNDGAFMTRITIFPHVNKFLDNPNVEDPSEKKKDINFQEKFEKQHLNSLFSVFCWGAAQYYEKMEKINIPEICKLKIEDNPQSLEWENIEKTIKNFFDENFKMTISTQDEISGSELYSTYLNWCGDSNKISNKSFGIRIKKLGLQSRILKGNRIFQKIKKIEK
jgi:phage/plasmid-associated DNA primase